jgi:hypothetical protein
MVIFSAKSAENASLFSAKNAENKGWIRRKDLTGENRGNGGWI